MVIDVKKRFLGFFLFRSRFLNVFYFPTVFYF